MRRMVKENLLKFDATPLFPERIANTVPYKLSQGEAPRRAWEMRRPRRPVQLPRPQRSSNRQARAEPCRREN
jgi:hypothetical protein